MAAAGPQPPIVWYRLTTECAYVGRDRLTVERTAPWVRECVGLINGERVAKGKTMRDTQELTAKIYRERGEAAHAAGYDTLRAFCARHAITVPSSLLTPQELCDSLIEIAMVLAGLAERLEVAGAESRTGPERRAGERSD